jgi:hypothetical protein
MATETAFAKRLVIFLEIVSRQSSNANLMLESKFWLCC